MIKSLSSILRLEYSQLLLAGRGVFLSSADIVFTYHFQTTANPHRFIKVWTSIADLPTSKFFVQTFFLEKLWLRNTLRTYDLDILCPNFPSFFFGSLSFGSFELTLKSELLLRTYLQNNTDTFLIFSFSMYFVYFQNLSTKVTSKFKKYVKLLEIFGNTI